MSGTTRKPHTARPKGTGRRVVIGGASHIEVEFELVDPATGAVREAEPFRHCVDYCPITQAELITKLEAHGRVQVQRAENAGLDLTAAVAQAAAALSAPPPAPAPVKAG